MPRGYLTSRRQRLINSREIEVIICRFAVILLMLLKRYKDLLYGVIDMLKEISTRRIKSVKITLYDIIWMSGEGVRNAGHFK